MFHFAQQIIFERIASIYGPSKWLAEANRSFGKIPFISLNNTKKKETA